MIFLDQILKEVSGLTNIQTSVDDILLWNGVDRHHFNSQKFSLALQKLEVWVQEWNMKFSPEICVVVCISRLRRCDLPPQFRFCGQELAQVRSMKYLGITVDNKLAWKTHVQNVSDKALTRLNDIRKFCATFWVADPRIVHRIVVGAVLPLLYYGSSAWVAALVSRGTLRSLERVLRLAGIVRCGLLRTTPTDVAITISGCLFPEIELRQGLIGFWLRSLTYGIDISKGVEEQIVTNFCSPQGILLSENRVLRPIRAAQNIVEERHRVERQLLYPYEPWKLHPTTDYIIREMEMAIGSLRADRGNSSSYTIWIFCDGSCTPTGAGSAALVSRGSNTYYFSLSHRSTGLHSSTQMELEGIRMGLHRLDIFRHNWEIKEVRIVTDPKTAIMAVVEDWNKLELAVPIHTFLWRLLDSISSIQLSWVLGHSGVPENEAAVFEAREAAAGASSSGISHATRFTPRRFSDHNSVSKALIVFIFWGWVEETKLQLPK